MRMIFVLRSVVALLFGAFSSATFLFLYTGPGIPGILLDGTYVSFLGLLVAVFVEIVFRMEQIRPKLMAYIGELFQQSVVPGAVVIGTLSLLSTLRVIERSEAEPLLVVFCITVVSFLTVVIILGWVFGHMLQIALRKR